MEFSLRRPGAGPAIPEPPVPYRREDVKVSSGEVTLAGTLTVPEGAGPFPAVALLSGSGAQDRDETVAGFRPFRDLADHLTRRGIAVLRLDDRGVGGSSGSFAAATMNDFAADAGAAVAFLRARPEIDRVRVGLLGHSEGGIVAPLAASMSRDVAFVVMLAAPTVRGDTLMLVQGELIGRVMGQPEAMRARNADVQRMMFHLALTGEGRAQTEQKVREVTRQAIGAPAEGGSPEQEAMVEQNVRAQMALADSPWFRTFVEYDPGPALARVTCPVLAVFGENDLQVPPALNLPPVEAAMRLPGRDVTLRVIPRVNHLFQQAESGSPGLYSVLPKEFAPGVLDTIGNWIGAKTRPR
jgi:pimeloyl-ACP methyl ester carboxylesterase